MLERRGAFKPRLCGEGFWVTTDQLRTAGLREAGDRCTSLRKELKVIHVKDIPAGPLGRWPESEILFKCE